MREGKWKTKERAYILKVILTSAQGRAAARRAPEGVAEYW